MTGVWKEMPRSKLLVQGGEAPQLSLQDWARVRCLGATALSERRGEKLAHKGFITHTSS